MVRRAIHRVDARWGVAPRAEPHETPNGFRSLSFANRRFLGEVVFDDRTFGGTTNFKGVRFERAPYFHGAKLHQDTDFAGAEFPDTLSEEAERAYRTLKLAMNQHHAHREEAMFFALELKRARSSHAQR